MSYILTQCIINWIVMSSIYLLMALGLTIIFSVMRILNFAHGAFYMLGGFVLYYVVCKFGLGYPLGFTLTFLFTGLLGLLIYKGLLKYFRLDMLVCLIITVGLASFLESGSYIVFGPYEKNVPPIISGVIQLGGMRLSLERLIVMFLGLGLTLVILLFIRYSKLGRALRAIAQDTEAAMLQGVSGERIFSVGMFLGCGLAGIAGAIMAPMFAVGPFEGQRPLMNAFIIVILGGLGSITGAIIGSFILGFIISFGSTFLSGEIASLICFVLLILILLFRKKGLFGEYE